MLNWWRAHAHNCFCTINARFFHLNILQGTQATCWFQKWKCPIFQWNIPQTLFWNDIYYMRENVKVKMLQKCIFELIYEQNHTLCPGTSREKMKKKKKNFFYICIYWNVPQTLFWNDIYFMRENVKVKMLQKCIFELIYEQNHTSYILEHQERKEKIWKDTNINIYIYIYIYI